MQSLRLCLGRVTVLTRVLWVVVLAASGCGIRPTSVHSDASGEAPAQTAYVPASGKGPAVIVLSGASGPRFYEAFAAALAKEGFYAVLLDGNDVSRDAQGAARLRSAIERAQSAPHVVPGKVAVVGFSLGGGAALVHAIATVVSSKKRGQSKPQHTSSAPPSRWLPIPTPSMASISPYQRTERKQMRTHGNAPLI